MPTNGPSAADWLLARGTWRSGYCLEACWAAYATAGAHTTVAAATALSAFNLSQGGGVHTDKTPPKGAAVWWGAKPSSAAGDICISVGGGSVVATDGAGAGRIGVMTIDARTRQIGRPYLGWTDRIFDCPIIIPSQNGDNDMTPDQANQLAQIYAAIFHGGTSMPDGGRGLAQSVADIAAGNRPAIQHTGADGKPFSSPWKQELADARTAALAPLSDADVQRIAQAVASVLGGDAPKS